MGGKEHDIQFTHKKKISSTKSQKKGKATSNYVAALLSASLSSTGSLGIEEDPFSRLDEDLVTVLGSEVLLEESVLSS